MFSFSICISFFSQTVCIHRLTLSIAGIVKEILTILLAVAIMPGEHLTFMNVLGLLVSMAGIAYFNYIKLLYVCL